MQAKKKGVTFLLAAAVTFGVFAALPSGTVLADTASAPTAQPGKPPTAAAAKDQQSHNSAGTAADPASAGKAQAYTAENRADTGTGTDTVTAEQAIADQLAAKNISYSKLSHTQQDNVYVDVIVQMSAAPASKNGTLRADYSSTAEIQRETDTVIAAQASVKKAAEQVTGQEPGRSYGYVFNGFTTKAKASDIGRLRQIAGVKSVTPAKVYYPSEANANSMANVQAVWSSYKYKGEHTVVAVIDTGIDPNHKDMRLSNERDVKLTRSDVSNFISKAKHGKYFTPKVPYGYNYADNNTIITDNSEDSQHGMHVAGIIGANGTGTDPARSVAGVAPEAQLLAMKVFSNSSTSSTTGTVTIVAAVEDSSKLGADVLNMSLGAASGDQTLQDPEQAAVQNANEAGTAAVISAGNSGTSASASEGVNKDFYGLSDLETVGTPGASRGATTVASGENSQVISQAVTFSDADGFKLGPESVRLSADSFAGSFNKKQFYVVRKANGELSTGDLGDYTSEAKGKIAIVNRGSMTFTDKQKYAQQAGAAGVVIVNNQTGSTSPFTGIALSSDFPAFGLSNVTGHKLIDWVDQHKDTALTVKIALMPLPNQSYLTDRMSTFTSYGPASDLSFKPDITAPGGNIWSTQNNNGYTNMSGTSMASPFVAGSQALLKQAMNNKDNKFYAYYQKLKGTQITDLLKTVEMNTAQPVKDTGHGNAIVSPRRQGAGMIDVKAAIDALENNPSTVVSENGYPAVELKSFNGRTTTFRLTFTNPTGQDMAYTIDSNDSTNAVYTSATDPATGVLYDTKIDGASIKAGSTINVPAGGTAQVEFQLVLPESFSTQQFVEGFLNFRGNDGTRLNIPYMGFFGDWNNGKIVDAINGITASPATGNYGTVPLMLNQDSGDQYYGGLYIDAQGSRKVNTDAVAFSTSSSALYNGIGMQYYMLRNTRDVKVEILDSSGNIVTTLSSSANQIKTIYRPSAGRYSYYYPPTWDGTYYDQSDGVVKHAKDGQYVYRISAVPSGGDRRQAYDVLFKLDSKAPVVRNVSLAPEQKQGKTVYYLSAEAKDDFSGLSISHNIEVSVNGISNPYGSYTVTGTTPDGYSQIRAVLTQRQADALAAGDNRIGAYLTDNAGNGASAEERVQKPGDVMYGLIIDKGGIPQKISQPTDGYEESPFDDGTGTYTFSGTYPGKVYGTYTDSQGKTHNMDITYNSVTRNFKGSLPLTAEDYHSTVNLYNNAARTQLVQSFGTDVRLKAPSFADVKINGGERQTSESSVEVSGTVSDDTESVTISTSTSGTPIRAQIDAGHKFSADIPVSYGSNRITVQLEDADGNTASTYKMVSSSYDAEVLKNAVTFNNGITFGTNEVTARRSRYYDAKTGIATITGKVKHPTTTLKVDGKNVPINDDLTFKFTLNLGTAGQKPFSVIVGDTTQDRSFQEVLTFVLDTVPPALALDNPTDRPAYTNDPEYRITGTATDNVNYLKLMINGSNVATQYEDVDINSGKPGRMDINYTARLVKGRNILTVAVTDSGNNTVTKKITVYYEPRKTLASPVITPSTTGPAASVTLTAKAASADETVRYSTDGATYQDVPAGGVVVTANGLLSFKSVDRYGNESAVVSYIVNNIQDNNGANAQGGDGQNADAAGAGPGTAAGSALLSETEQTALLNRIHTVREALGPELAAQANTATGRSFAADCDALAALVQSGKVTASQGEAKLGALLDSAVERISADIKSAPAAAENASGLAGGSSWSAAADTARTAAKSSGDMGTKLSYLQKLKSLREGVTAAAAGDSAKAAAAGEAVKTDGAKDAESSSGKASHPEDAARGASASAGQQPSAAGARNPAGTSNPAVSAPQGAHGSGSGASGILEQAPYRSARPSSLAYTGDEAHTLLGLSALTILAVLSAFAFAKKSRAIRASRAAHKAQVQYSGNGS